MITFLSDFKSNSFSPKMPLPPSEVVPKNHVFTDMPYENECGKSLSTNSLILNGNKVQVGVYPWLVAIFRVKSIGVSYICSGSLISNKHIVTGERIIVFNK